tara:strand:- start:42 stop:581 length:540 start_codon:yes stop_codon:yes gene_type:complete
MAISDMKGTVTTTGIMNNKPAPMRAPNMSKIKMPTARKPAPVKEVAKPVEQPKEMTLAEKVQNLTDQDKIVLSTVLSPSVSSVLKKIAPDLSPLLDQAGPAEENVIIPVSVAKNFAAKRYGGQNETEAVSNFIADLQSSVPGIDNMMGQSTVPPGTQMSEQPDNMISPEMENEDSGLLA